MSSARRSRRCARGSRSSRSSSACAQWKHLHIGLPRASIAAWTTARELTRVVGEHRIGPARTTVAIGANHATDVSRRAAIFDTIVKSCSAARASADFRISSAPFQRSRLGKEAIHEVERSFRLQLRKVGQEAAGPPQAHGHRVDGLHRCDDLRRWRARARRRMAWWSGDRTDGQHRRARDPTLDADRDP